MYCCHARLCVCLSLCVSVCLSVPGRTPTLLHGPGCNLGNGRGCRLVVHYWADLQSGHGLRCYGNTTRTLVASLRPSRDDDLVRTLGGVCTRCWSVTGRRQRVVLSITVVAWTAGFRGGVLATKPERKMSASTCLYSLYAWFIVF